MTTTPNGTELTNIASQNKINSLTTDEQEIIEDELIDINVIISKSDVFPLRCCKLDGMPHDVMVGSGAFVPCCFEDAFPHQSDAVELSTGCWSDDSNKDDKKNPLSKDANGSERRSTSALQAVHRQ